MASKLETIQIGGKTVTMEKFNTGRFVVAIEDNVVSSGLVDGGTVEWVKGEKQFSSPELDSMESWLLANDGTNVNDLRDAVLNLLSELRIDKKCLSVMANGYSPDYPGALDTFPGEGWTNPCCKIQISKVVAKELIDAGIFRHLKSCSGE